MAGGIEEPFRFDFQTDLLHSGSISFGRFESESLSWEKRSSFSHNRYLEEVEKYSKPGSVIEKKAYFEAHFRRKALLKQSQDGTDFQTTEHDDLQDSQESESSYHNNQKSEKQKVETTNDKVKPKMKARVQRIISSEPFVKPKTRENKSLLMKEKQKKSPRPANPIMRKTFKSEESNMSLPKAKTLPLNKSIVKESKSEKTMETKKSLPRAHQTAIRTKRTNITLSVNPRATGFNFRSDQRAERRKEEKRAATEMAESRKSVNFKANPMPSFYKESEGSRRSSLTSLTNSRNLPRKSYVPEKKKEPSSHSHKHEKEVKGVYKVSAPKLGYLLN